MQALLTLRRQGSLADHGEHAIHKGQNVSVGRMQESWNPPNAVPETTRPSSTVAWHSIYVVGPSGAAKIPETRDSLEGYTLR